MNGTADLNEQIRKDQEAKHECHMSGGPANAAPAVDGHTKDEVWTANMPDCHLKGVPAAAQVGKKEMVQEKVDEEEEEEESDKEEEKEEEEESDSDSDDE